MVGIFICLFMSIALLLIACLAIYIIVKEDFLKIPMLLVAFLSLFISIIFGIEAFKAHEQYVLKNNEVIPAIEVYRGNTDLLITYNDSIPVDSIVILKKK